VQRLISLPYAKNTSPFPFPLLDGSDEEYIFFSFFFSQRSLIPSKISVLFLFSRSLSLDTTPVNLDELPSTLLFSETRRQYLPHRLEDFVLWFSGPPLRKTLLRLTFRFFCPLAKRLEKSFFAADPLIFILRTSPVDLTLS